MTSLIAAQRLGFEPYNGSPRLELRSTDSDEQVEVVIRGPIDRSWATSI